MNIKNKIKSTVTERLFDIIKKPVSKMTREELIEYSKEDDVVEMVQAVIDRYDEALQALNSSRKKNYTEIRTDIDNNLEKINSVFSSLSSFADTLSLIQKNLVLIQDFLKSDKVEVKHWTANTEYADISFDGAYMLSSIQEKLHPALVHKYCKIYLDGCLLMYGSDYTVEALENKIKITFAEPVTSGSNVLYEFVKL